MSHNYGDFKAQLGKRDHEGFLPHDERLKRIQPKQNPYVVGSALRGNSPVFYGRAQTLHEILGILRGPSKPGCISLLGERRIGKSSLLNQAYQSLSAEEGDGYGIRQCPELVPDQSGEFLHRFISSHPRRFT